MQALADQLAGVRGWFILSLNDVPEVRAVFAQFHMTEVATTYTIAQAKAQPRSELLISNWALDGA